jgi:hypothetical protein
MKLELAKAGSHNGVTLAPKDIREMAETFAGDIPVTIGHEIDDTMPAYGWVKSLEVTEDSQTLIGELEIGKELSEALAEGRYKNWSIGAGKDEDGRMYLHHVAFLGAVPPMIKDLKLIEMGDKSEIITMSINSEKCSFKLSDREISEYSALKNKEREQAVRKLSDASKGKLPFGKREKLIEFADRQLMSDSGVDTVELLTEIFESVKAPVSTGTSKIFSTSRTESRTSVFSKI